MYGIMFRSLNSELITKWGGAESSQVPGEFIGGAHSMWDDSHGDLYLGEIMLEDHHRTQKYIRLSCFFYYGDATPNPLTRKLEYFSN